MVILQLEEQPPLIQAVFAGKIEQARNLLEHKEDVNYQDYEKRSALHAAAFRGDAEMTKLLIDHGARVNTKDSKWLTPLHRACSSGSEETVSILLNHSADTSARDRQWQTPLHIAAAYNALDCISSLLDKVPNPNVTDRSGRTALHHAVLNGHNDIIELLISKGCVLNACDKKDCRPIHWAAQAGHVDTIELLLRHGADINARDRNLYMPLHVAAASGMVSACRILLSYGADVDSQNAYGNTPLHIACLNGHLSVCQELVSNGCDKEALNYRGQTPLHIAAASTHGVQCLNYLVCLRVNINKQSLDGRTPLHMTAIHGRFTRSKTLIDRGAIVDCVDKNGCTALHIAAQHGHELLSNTLLSYGADASKKGHEGRTALHMCCLSGYVECCRTFMKAGVDINAQDDFGKTPTHCASYKGSVECLDLLVSNGADFKVLDNIGRTALHYAAVQGYFDCVFTLVGIGSSVNQADNEGCTALHLAAAYDLEGRCVDYLIQHKADPRLKDKNGFTPMHYAVAGNNLCGLRYLLDSCGSSYLLFGRDMPPTTPLHLAAKNGNMEILEKLMPYFPDPSIKTEHGCTALLLAAREGFANCVQLLLRFGAKVSVCDSVYNMSPVHHSAKNGHVHCLALLVDNAEDKSVIDLPDKLQRTALMLAVSNSHSDCVLTLIKSGADPNIVDSDFHSCLFRSVVTGQHNILQMLLPQSSTINKQDINGKTVLHIAAACGRVTCLQRILHYMDHNVAASQDNQDFTALHWACYSGSAECVEHLLNEGIFKELEGNLFSAVHCATSAGSEKCLTILCTYFGAGIVKLRDKRNRTPLHIAALHGRMECALFLLQQGAEIECQDEDGRTPLIAAAQNGQVQVIEVLIGYKADMTSFDKNGNTALHLACLQKHNHAALLLLEYTNDTNIINMANNDRKTPLHLSARNGLVDVTRQLILKGSSVIAVDSNGLTPALCCAPNPSVAQCLAIILASYPGLTTNNKKALLLNPELFKTSKRTSVNSQTEISLVKNPDQFELEQMFKVKFQTDSNSKYAKEELLCLTSSIVQNFFVSKHLKKKRRKITETSCFICENYDVNDDSFTKKPACFGHDLHKSQSNMTLTNKMIYSEEDYGRIIQNARSKGKKIILAYPQSQNRRLGGDSGKQKRKLQEPKREFIMKKYLESTVTQQSEDQKRFSMQPLKARWKVEECKKQNQARPPNFLLNLNKRPRASTIYHDTAPQSWALQVPCVEVNDKTTKRKVRRGGAKPKQKTSDVKDRVMRLRPKKNNQMEETLTTISSYCDHILKTVKADYTTYIPKATSHLQNTATIKSNELQHNLSVMTFIDGSKIDNCGENLLLTKDSKNKIRQVDAELTTIKNITKKQSKKKTSLRNLSFIHCRPMYISGNKTRHCSVFWCFPKINKQPQDCHDLRSSFTQSAISENSSSSRRHTAQGENSSNSQGDENSQRTNSNKTCGWLEANAAVSSKTSGSNRVHHDSPNSKNTDTNTNYIQSQGNDFCYSLSRASFEANAGVSPTFKIDGNSRSNGRQAYDSPNGRNVTSTSNVSDSLSFELGENSKKFKTSHIKSAHENSCSSCEAQDSSSSELDENLRLLETRVRYCFETSAGAFPNVSALKVDSSDTRSATVTSNSFKSQDYFDSMESNLAPTNFEVSLALKVDENLSFNEAQRMCNSSDLKARVRRHFESSPDASALKIDENSSSAGILNVKIFDSSSLKLDGNSKAGDFPDFKVDGNLDNAQCNSSDADPYLVQSRENGDYFPYHEIGENSRSNVNCVEMNACDFPDLKIEEKKKIENLEQSKLTVDRKLMLEINERLQRQVEEEYAKRNSSSGPLHKTKDSTKQTNEWHDVTDKLDLFQAGKTRTDCVTQKIENYALCLQRLAVQFDCLIQDISSFQDLILRMLVVDAEADCIEDNFLADNFSTFEDDIKLIRNLYSKRDEPIMRPEEVVQLDQEILGLGRKIIFQYFTTNKRGKLPQQLLEECLKKLFEYKTVEEQLQKEAEFTSLQTTPGSLGGNEKIEVLEEQLQKEASFISSRDSLRGNEGIELLEERLQKEANFISLQTTRESLRGNEDLEVLSNKKTETQSEGVVSITVGCQTRRAKNENEINEDICQTTRKEYGPEALMDMIDELYEKRNGMLRRNEDIETLDKRISELEIKIIQRASAKHKLRELIQDDKSALSKIEDNQSNAELIREIIVKEKEKEDAAKILCEKKDYLENSKESLNSRKFPPNTEKLDNLKESSDFYLKKKSHSLEINNNEARTRNVTEKCILKKQAATTTMTKNKVSPEFRTERTRSELEGDTCKLKASNYDKHFKIEECKSLVKLNELLRENDPKAGKIEFFEGIGLSKTNAEEKKEEGDRGQLLNQIGDKVAVHGLHSQVKSNWAEGIAESDLIEKLQGINEEIVDAQVIIQENEIQFDDSEQVEVNGQLEVEGIDENQQRMDSLRGFTEESKLRSEDTKENEVHIDNREITIVTVSKAAKFQIEEDEENEQVLNEENKPQVEGIEEIELFRKTVTTSQGLTKENKLQIEEEQEKRGQQTKDFQGFTEESKLHDTIEENEEAKTQVNKYIFTADDLRIEESLSTEEEKGLQAEDTQKESAFGYCRAISVQDESSLSGTEIHIEETRTVSKLADEKQSQDVTQESVTRLQLEKTRANEDIEENQLRSLTETTSSSFMTLRIEKTRAVSEVSDAKQLQDITQENVTKLQFEETRANEGIEENSPKSLTEAISSSLTMPRNQETRAVSEVSNEKQLRDVTEESVTTLLLEETRANEDFEKYQHRDLLEAITLNVMTLRIEETQAASEVTEDTGEKKPPGATEEILSCFTTVHVSEEDNEKPPQEITEENATRLKIEETRNKEPRPHGLTEETIANLPELQIQETRAVLDHINEERTRKLRIEHTWTVPEDTDDCVTKERLQIEQMQDIKEKQFQPSLTKSKTEETQAVSNKEQPQRIAITESLSIIEEQSQNKDGQDVEADEKIIMDEARGLSYSMQLLGVIEENVNTDMSCAKQLPIEDNVLSECTDISDGGQDKSEEYHDLIDLDGIPDIQNELSDNVFYDAQAKPEETTDIYTQSDSKSGATPLQVKKIKSGELKAPKTKKSFPSLSKLNKKAKKDSTCKIS